MRKQENKIPTQIKDLFIGMVSFSERYVVPVAFANRN